MKKKKFFDLSPVDNTGAKWKMLIGMRSRGKSYEVKYKAIKKNRDKKKLIAYIRRWDTDIKESFVTSYFEDMTEAKNGYKAVEDITGGEWQGVQGFRGFLYYYRNKEDGKIERSEPIGRYFSLNTAERYKSQSFKNYGTIIVEEISTDAIYLNDEPNRLMNLISTITRDDDDVDIYLIGNKISRVSPYFSEWNLHNVPFQKEGTVEVYHLERMDGDIIDFAVYNTDKAETKSKLFFGASSKQIQGNEWDVKEVPKLEKPYEYYESVYKCLVKYTSFSFKVELLVDTNNGGAFVYVYPFKRERSKIKRIITDTFSVDPLISPCFDSRRTPEKKIIECFRLGKVCYSDNLTGADFTNLRNNYDMGV